LPAVFLVDVRFPEEAGAAGAALAGVVLELAGAAGVAAAGVLAGAASAAAALDFLRLFLALDAAGAAVSAGAVFEALSDAAAFLLFRDFFVVAAVVSLAADLSAAAAFFSAAAFSFFACFLDFLVVEESELVSVELACPLAKAGEIATASIRQKASIHRVTLFWKRFICTRTFHELSSWP
jgi:hypothetical protein